MTRPLAVAAKQPGPAAAANLPDSDDLGVTDVAFGGLRAAQQLAVEHHRGADPGSDFMRSTRYASG